MKSTEALFYALLKAESEADVDSVLRDAGYFDYDAEHWLPLDDSANNWAIAGNLNSHATGAIVEKLINAIDAVLIAGCWSKGIDPRSASAPKSMSEAAQNLFGVRDGRLESVQAQTRTELADNVHFIAVGQKPPNYLIVDRGEGQSPANFKKTFLSLRGTNKFDIPFVQGINNMGGAAVLRFCGTGGYELIASRRHPNCPVNGEPTDRDWAFTLIRQVLPQERVRRRRMFAYLAPDGAIPTFKSDEIAVLPSATQQRPTPYSAGLPFGTVIKLYAYNWAARSLATTNAREALEGYLYSLALPIRITEARPSYTKGKTHTFQTTLSGLGVNIATHRDTKRGSRLEEGFCQLPLKLNLPEIGQLDVFITVYRAKDDDGKKYELKHIPHGIVFTVNGQVHFHAASTFIRDKLKYDYLDKHMLVCVDCTRMDTVALDKFFMTSRDRVADDKVKKALETALIQHLSKEDSPLRTALRELNARRREEELKETLNDDEPARVLEDLIRMSPSLAAIFLPGSRIKTPGPHDEQQPYKGQRFPTYFRIRKEPKDGLIRNCPINRTCRVEFETDADNDYFDRADTPGRIRFFPAGIERAWTLRDGRLGATFTVPPNARVGDSITVTVAVDDETRVQPFTCSFELHVLDAASDPEPKLPGPKRPKGGNGLAIPTIIPVTSDGRDIEGKPSKKWGDGNELHDEFAALQLRSAGEDGQFDVYLNFDNLFLQNELRSERDTGEHPLILYSFKYGLTLAAMGMLQEHKRKQNGSSNGRIMLEREEEDLDDGEPDELDMISKACAGLAAVIVPVAQKLSQKAVLETVEA